MTNYSPHPPHIFASLSNGRFEGDRIDDLPPPRIIGPGPERHIMTPDERRESKRLQKQRYRVTHRETYLAQKCADSRNRRAAKRHAGGTVTVKQWADLLDKYKHTCLRCGCNDVKMTQDHVLPISIGGTHSVDNLQPLCALCNSIKGTKHIDFRP